MAGSSEDVAALMASQTTQRPQRRRAAQKAVKNIDAAVRDCSLDEDAATDVLQQHHHDPRAQRMSGKHKAKRQGALMRANPLGDGAAVQGADMNKPVNCPKCDKIIDYSKHKPYNLSRQCCAACAKRQTRSERIMRDLAAKQLAKADGTARKTGLAAGGSHSSTDSGALSSDTATTTTTAAAAAATRKGSVGRTNRRRSSSGETRKATAKASIVVQKKSPKHVQPTPRKQPQWTPSPPDSPETPMELTPSFDTCQYRQPQYHTQKPQQQPAIPACAADSWTLNAGGMTAGGYLLPVASLGGSSASSLDGDTAMHVNPSSCHNADTSAAFPFDFPIQPSCNGPVAGLDAFGLAGNTIEFSSDVLQQAGIVINRPQFERWCSVNSAMPQAITDNIARVLTDALTLPFGASDIQQLDSFIQQQLDDAPATDRENSESPTASRNSDWGALATNRTFRGKDPRIYSMGSVLVDDDDDTPNRRCASTPVVDDDDVDDEDNEYIFQDDCSTDFEDHDENGHGADTSSHKVEADQVDDDSAFESRDLDSDDDSEIDIGDDQDVMTSEVEHSVEETVEEWFSKRPSSVPATPVGDGPLSQCTATLVGVSTQGCCCFVVAGAASRGQFWAMVRYHPSGTKIASVDWFSGALTEQQLAEAECQEQTSVATSRNSAPRNSAPIVVTSMV